MTTDIYAAPESELTAQTKPNEFADEFYVVSSTKFWLMFLTTLGLYQIFWFYKNWSLYDKKHGEGMWPVARAIFSIFFAHSLFNRVEHRISERKIDHMWYPEMLATLFVVFVIVSRILDKVVSKQDYVGILDLLSFLIYPAIGFILYRAQKAINAASDDPEGAANCNITWANGVWILCGLALWAVVLLGYSTFF